MMIVRASVISKFLQEDFAGRKFALTSSTTK